MESTFNSNFDFEALEQQCLQQLASTAETELDIRRGDQKIKLLNATINLAKVKDAYKNTQLREQELLLKQQQLYLDEMNLKFTMAKELSVKPDKMGRIIGKVMLTIWPEQDKQVLAILKATQKIKEIKGEE